MYTLIPIVNFFRTSKDGRRKEMSCRRCTALSILVLLTNFYLPLSLMAQSPPCPTTVPPTGAGWTAWTHATSPRTISVSCPPGTCYITFDYCYRAGLTNYPTPGTTTNQVVVIGDIIKSGNCSCYDSVLFNAIQDELVIIGGEVFNEPPCDPLYTPLRLEGIMPGCWKKTSEGYDNCENSDICIQACDICYLNGQIVRSNCSYSYIGTSCENHPLEWDDTDTSCYRKRCGGSQ